MENTKSIGCNNLVYPVYSYILLPLHSAVFFMAQMLGAIQFFPLFVWEKIREKFKLWEGMDNSKVLKATLLSVDSVFYKMDCTFSEVMLLFSNVPFK